MAVARYGAHIRRSHLNYVNYDVEGLRWSRLSEEIFRLDKWVSAGVRLPSGMAVR
jgi:hypothetical protein